MHWNPYGCLPNLIMPNCIVWLWHWQLESTTQTSQCWVQPVLLIVNVGLRGLQQIIDWSACCTLAVEICHGVTLILQKFSCSVTQLPRQRIFFLINHWGIILSSRWQNQKLPRRIWCLAVYWDNFPLVLWWRFICHFEECPVYSLCSVH